MTPVPRSTLDLPPAAALRWERMAVAIRLGLDAQQPALLRRYVALGHRLARTGTLAPEAVWPRMLALLLQTASDEALPPFWRSICLEHATMPLAQATTLARRGAWQGLPALLARLEALQIATGAAG